MENFVPYEFAVKLKEKGFKEKCLAYYDIDDNVGLLYNTQYSDEYSPCQYTDLLQSHNTDTTVAQPDDSGNCCDAPTIPQVLKWLREEKKIHIAITIIQDNNERFGGWNCIIVDFSSKNYRYVFDVCRYKNENSSYKLAALAGIEYCLDNLI